MEYTELSRTPFWGKRTAKKVGAGVVGRFASEAAEAGELICYHCKNLDCERMNYYVRTADVEGFIR
jgi:hypothetical protein